MTEITFSFSSISDAVNSACDSGKEYVNWAAYQVKTVWNEDWAPLLEKIQSSFLGAIEALGENLNTYRGLGAGLALFGFFTVLASRHLAKNNNSKETLSNTEGQAKRNAIRILGIIALAVGTGLVICGGGQKII